MYILVLNNINKIKYILYALLIYFLIILLIRIIIYLIPLLSVFLCRRVGQVLVVVVYFFRPKNKLMLQLVSVFYLSKNVGIVQYLTYIYSIFLDFLQARHLACIMEKHIYRYQHTFFFVSKQIMHVGCIVGCFAALFVHFFYLFVIITEMMLFAQYFSNTGLF